MSQATIMVDGVPRSGQIAREGRDEMTHEVALTRVDEALCRVRQRCMDLPVLAIRWMFIKHSLHPVQKTLMRAAGWAEGPSDAHGQGGTLRMALRLKMEYLWRILRCLLYGVQLSCRLVDLRVRLRPDLAALKRRSFDLIAKTCCFGTRRSPDGSDFYYGDLQQRAAQRGVQMLLLCSDLRDVSWKEFAKSHLATAPLCRLPEWCLVHPLIPLRMMWQQIASSWRLRRLLRQAHDPLERAVIGLAARECLTPHTAATALNFWIAKTAVDTWHPRALMTFYEGHAWERCAWWGARTADASCRIVGYQHTAVFQASRSVTVPAVDLRERSLPDIVLCLGQGPLELMRAGLEPYHTRLIRVGSFRYRGCRAEGPAAPSRRTVLVTPEGIPSEVQALFAFALVCARQMPSYTFVLRCHPEIPMPDALRLVSADLSGQPNIVLSEHRSLDEDCDRASVLLSRGSSTVIYAILRGLMPIYGPLEAAMPDWDPLYKLSVWRKHCATPQDMAECLEAYEQTPREQLEAEWEQAARYVQDYTGPVADDRIEAILSEVGLNRHKP